MAVSAHLPVELCRLPEAAGTQEAAAAISAGEVDDQAIERIGPEGEDAAVVVAAGTVIGAIVVVAMIGRAPGHDHGIGKRRRRRITMIGVEAVPQSLDTAARVALLDLSGR